MPRPAGARCFISYSHTPRDEAALRYLVGVLARWGLQPWWDGNLVATSGVALNREVAAAIEQADVVLVLLSSQSAASMYCLGEVGYCLERSKRIVRIDVEPVATPAGLLPLSAARGVVWHGVTQGQAEADLARALTAEGIVLDQTMPRSDRAIRNFSRRALIGPVSMRCAWLGLGPPIRQTASMRSASPWSGCTSATGSGPWHARKLRPQRCPSRPTRTMRKRWRSA
jgi:hypothetical protein